MTDIDKSIYITLLSILLNIWNIFIYSPKNDLSLPKIILNDVATMPKATPIIIAFLPATVGYAIIQNNIDFEFKNPGSQKNIEIPNKTHDIKKDLNKISLFLNSGAMNINKRDVNI